MIASSILAFFVTMLLATLPIIEIRGAMPIGMSTTFWGDSALSPVMSLLASLIGGVIACFVVVATFFPLKKLLCRVPFFSRIFANFENTAIENLAKISSKLEKFKKNTKNKEKIKKKSKLNKNSIKNNLPNTKIENTQSSLMTDSAIDFKKPKKQNRTLQKCTLVFVFCALPLPFTGVWSAGALASLLNLHFWPSVLSLILANVLGSLVVFCFCAIFSNYIDLIIAIMAVILVLFAIYYIALYCTKKLSKLNN